MQASGRGSIVDFSKVCNYCTVRDGPLSGSCDRDSLYGYRDCGYCWSSLGFIYVW